MFLPIALGGAAVLLMLASQKKTGPKPKAGEVWTLGIYQPTLDTPAEWQSFMNQIGQVGDVMGVNKTADGTNVITIRYRDDSTLVPIGGTYSVGAGEIATLRFAQRAPIA